MNYTYISRYIGVYWMQIKSERGIVQQTMEDSSCPVHHPKSHNPHFSSIVGYFLGFAKSFALSASIDITQCVQHGMVPYHRVILHTTYIERWLLFLAFLHQPKRQKHNMVPLYCTYRHRIFSVLIYTFSSFYTHTSSSSEICSHYKLLYYSKRRQNNIHALTCKNQHIQKAPVGVKVPI
jgi:hypothetical protein